MSQTLKDGFEKFVVRALEGCWGWKGGTPDPGYGMFRSKMKQFRAHRASWTLHFGEIPKGMCVLHKCDNKICSNPDHLFLGTDADNALDMLKKGYHPTLGKAGEASNLSTLKEFQVREIRKLLSLGNTIKDVALLFSVSNNAIGKIKRNISWKGIQ